MTETRINGFCLFLATLLGIVLLAGLCLGLMEVIQVVERIAAGG